MQPVTSLAQDTCSEIRFVLADIDDTMTAEGKLPAQSYQALWDLHDAGIQVIPVTGRPAGWCDLICRQWPVAGVVGENGAFVFYLEEQSRRTVYHPCAPPPEQNRARLAEIAAEVYASIAGTRPAKDQFSRLFDVAIDFREEPPLLDFAIAEQIKAIFELRGANAKVSSIHVNAWFGTYDKLSMTRHFLARHFGIDIDDSSDNRKVLFCGDSPNDEPMFGAFELSVAVANIAPFLPMLRHPPSYVSPYESASGFAHLVRFLLQSRTPAR